MTITLEEFLEGVNKQPTDIWGLKYFPDISKIYDNDNENPIIDQDGKVFPEISDCNRDVVKTVIHSFGGNLKSIMEIGVHRSESNGDDTFTSIFLKEKPQHCIYIGIDLGNKSFLDDKDNNIFTLECNSIEQDRVRNFLKKNNVDKLDILSIDGYHSVNMTVNDWKYADLLSDNGVVIIHDTNYHPGDVVMPYAVDENIFEITKHCLGSDCGIAVFKKRQS